MRAPDPLGLQIVVPRRIAASDIHRIRPLPHTLGWRYSPAARARGFCGCIQCNPPGSINARRKRQAWDAS
jgi:hypothetical protein